WGSSSSSSRRRGGAMRSYAVRRSLTVIPVLLGVSILVFGFVHLIPGAPATAMSGEKATPERTEAVKKRLGLDRPIHEQYLLYMTQVLRAHLRVPPPPSQ